MNKNLVTSAFLAATVIGAIAASKSDPVLMKINNRPVHKSEFEYLYHKNSSQQLQPQTLDEYVDMFVNYKLKVADAEAAGLDTTETFRLEYNQFKADLAEPYTTEKATLDSLVEVAYSHQPTLLKVSHLMFPLGQNSEEIKLNEHKLDSLRNEIINGNADWDQMCAKYSVDGGSRDNGGSMGWLMVGRFPWPFEDMAYKTKKGEISQVVNSGVGFHIIRVDDTKPNPGEAKASHILKLTRNLDNDAKQKARLQIDSIYNLLKNGADFADMAKRESQDPGSAKNGGELGWFGPGMMVQPFDSVAFALDKGQISEPIETAFGYHIIYKTDQRPIESIEDMRSKIEAQINNDERSLIMTNKHNSRLINRYNAKFDQKGLDKIRKLIESNKNGYDSIAIDKLKESDLTIFTIGKSKTPVKEIMPVIPITASKDVDHAMSLIKQTAKNLMIQKLSVQERNDLIDENQEYRNLVNEYRDGILLFARASEMVWDKASKDTEGLEKFFNAHKEKYAWEAPKFKGYIVMAVNDSILEQAKQLTDSIGKNSFSHEDLVKKMRSRFGRDVKIERVIAAKGDNPISDYLAFDGPKPESTKPTWNSYYAFDGRIINAPEEAADVRGAVTTDYQNALEKAWIKQLREKYPVTINRQVLQTVK